MLVYLYELILKSIVFRAGRLCSRMFKIAQDVDSFDHITIY